MSSVLKIIHLVHTPGPGGTETVVENLITWAPRNFVCHAVAGPSGALAEIVRSRSVPFFEVPFTEMRRSGGVQGTLASAISGPRITRTLRRIIDEFQPDIIHSHAVKTTILARAALRGRRCPVLLWHLHDFIPLGRFRTALIRMATGSADAIAAVSEDVASIVGRAKDVTVIHNAIELPERKVDCVEDGRLSPNIPEGMPVFGYAGRLDPEKGLGVLLKAFAHVLTATHEARLLMAGDSPFQGPATRDYWEAEVRRLGLEQHVTFLGRLADLNSFYPLLDCFVLPAPREPFGLVVLEALAHGIPVIACDAGGPPEILDGFSGSLLVPPNDDQAMGKTMITMVKEPSYAQVARESGKIHVSSRFSPSIQMNKVTELYEAIRR